MRKWQSVVAGVGLLCLWLVAAPAGAGIIPGVLDDFEDGTRGGWLPPRDNTTNVAGGPAGSTRALQIDPAERLAAFDDGTDVSGAVAPSVTGIEVDMLRPAGTPDREMRLVLFGPTTGDRWTSTLAQILPGNGVWDTYHFSILESDLTQVQGLGTYADLLADLDRIMLRFDSGAPSATGTTVSDSEAPFFIDNVTAVPAPGVAWVLAGPLLALARRAVSRSSSP